MKTISELISELVNLEFNAEGIQISQQYQLGQLPPKRETIAESLYARFLNKFGLPNLADVNMVAMAMSLANLRYTHPRIGMFTSFAFEEHSSKVICRF